MIDNPLVGDVVREPGGGRGTIVTGPNAAGYVELELDGQTPTVWMHPACLTLIAHKA